MQSEKLLRAIYAIIQKRYKHDLGPGPSSISSGRVPADPELRRLPLLIWGDVFPSGDRPQVRRVLAGADAHECMYAWVYLNEQVSLREFADLSRGQRFEPARSPDEIRHRFASLKASANDPQSQIGADLLDIFLPAVVFFAAAGEDRSEFCELGSTFYASIEKLDLCGSILGSPLDRAKLLFSGIEYSPFLRRSSLFFHPQDHIRLVADSAEWERSREHVFHMSRFVGSYAFRSTEDFSAAVSKSDAFHVTDVFNLQPTDFHSWDLGLPITFMNLPQLVDRLNATGFEVFLTKADPEFHAAGACRAMVARLFGIRREVAEKLEYFERFAQFGGLEAVVGSRRLRPGEGRSVLRDVETSLTTTQWNLLADYKRYFPIWGRAPIASKEELEALVSAGDLGIDLRFDTGQAASVVRHAIRQKLWNPG